MPMLLPMTSGRRDLLAAAALLALLLAGCQTGTQRFIGLGGQLENAELSDRQLRRQLHEFVRTYAASTEAVMDDIDDQTDDPAVAEWVRDYKIQAINECMAAAFDPDPYLAAVDLWVYMRQLRYHMESPEVVAILGKDEVAARMEAEHVLALEAELDRIILLATGGAAPDKLGKMDEWARENPMRLNFTRPSVTATVAAQMTEKQVGGLAVAGNLDSRMEDVTDRLTIYASILPKQVRWQAEVVVSKAIEEIFDDIRLLTAEIAAILAGERVAVLEGVAAEREIVLAEVDRQRTETLAFVREERLALTADLVAELDRQRVETLAVFTAEIDDMLAWGDRQRDEAIRAVNQLTAEMMSETTGEVRDTVKQALVWIFLEVLILGALAAGVLFMLLRGLGKIAMDVRLAERS